MPAELKDAYNKTRPDTDDARVKKFMLTPEFAQQINALPAELLNNELGVPIKLPVKLNAPVTDRTDLVQVFLTGMAGLNQIDKNNPVAADTLKINWVCRPRGRPTASASSGAIEPAFPTAAASRMTPSTSSSSSWVAF
jgi:uncharacterized protein DUF4331